MELDAASRSLIVGDNRARQNKTDTSRASGGALTTGATDGPGTGTGANTPKGEYKNGLSSSIVQEHDSIRLEVEEAQFVEKNGRVAPNSQVLHRAVIVAPVFLIALGLGIAALALDLWLQNTNKEFDSSLDSIHYINNADAVLTMISAGSFHICLSRHASKFNVKSIFYMKEPGCTRNMTIVDRFYRSIQSSESFQIPTAVTVTHLNPLVLLHLPRPCEKRDKKQCNRATDVSFVCGRCYWPGR